MKMNKVIILLWAILAVACTSERPKKPSASGKTGEMLVVMSQTRWEGSAGEAVKDAFMAGIPTLNQAEPYFNLFHVETSNFTKLFETHRNIFMVEFDASLEKGSIEAQRDPWAYPQMVIRVKVPNEEVLRKILENNQLSFIDYYVKTERERLINAYGRMVNHQARNDVRKNLGLDITVPEGYFVAKQEDNFVWLRQTATREELELGVLITVLPYTDPDTDFAHETIRERRDSITREHIPGTFEGTYMVTYPDIPHVYSEINFNDVYAVEARGYWRVKDDFMGGPFVNITFVDEQNSRLINLDGFVYAPKYDKRDYLRQVEALMYSVEVFSEEEATPSEEV
ncbi:MAG: DUF4837 family protein [bacterium]